MDKIFRLFVFTAFSALISLFPVCASAGLMATNDFRYGDEGTKQDAFTVYAPTSENMLVGVQGAFSKKNSYGKIYTARIPITYTGELNMATITPFVYSHHAGMTAYGGRFALSTVLSLKNETKDSFMITLNGGHALIKADDVNDGLVKFQQTALGLSVEATIQHQFKFTVEGSGFFKPTKGMNNDRLASSVFDFKDLIDINGYQIIDEIPNAIVSVRARRTFQPDFENAIYIGYSKMSFRNMGSANSYIAGMEFFVSDDITWDIGYNYFKYHEVSAKQYFRVGVSTTF